MLNRQDDFAYALIQQGKYNDNFNVNSVDLVGNSYLHYAAIASSYSSSLFWELVNNGADICAVNNDNDSILHMLAKFNPSLVKEIADKGANLHVVNNNGESLLHLAAQSSYDLTAYLLKNEVNKVYDFNNNGRTPLHAATEKGNLSIIELLIDNMIDINLRSDLPNCSSPFTSKCLA